ncbi:MAG: EamA family transporter [Bryobacteraceae bacterium]
MNIGYLYMFLGLFSFSVLGVLHKLAEVMNCRPRMINLLLFGWSTLLVAAFVLLSPGLEKSIPGEVGLIALPSGLGAGLAILTFQAGIRYGKIATSWLIINLSAGLPVLGSIALYHERVDARKAIALVSILISMLFLWKDKRDQEAREAASKAAGA